MQVTAHSFFGFNGGASQHATSFFDALERSGVEVLRAQLNEQTAVPTGGIHIFLCGVQEFSSIMKNSTGIKGTKIGFVAWESTRYPDHFIDALPHLDQLWVPSQWQRDCTIKQLEEIGFDAPDVLTGPGETAVQRFVRVVPEGVDPSIFHPGDVREPQSDLYRNPMRWMIFGRWEDRKCTMRMIAEWLQTFPLREDPLGSQNELLISADNAFPVDQYKTTEERLKAYGLNDPRIIVVHFPAKTEYVKYLQEGHVLLNVSRGEGWGLPIIEGMACGIPVVCHGWSGNTEFCKNACVVPSEKLIKPFNVYGVPDCPGEWGEPNWGSYRWWLREIHDNYLTYRDAALKASIDILVNFSWDAAAQRALELLRPLDVEGWGFPVKQPDWRVHIPIVGKEPEPEVEIVAELEDACIELIAAAFHSGYEVDRSHRGNPVLRKKDKSVFVLTGEPDSHDRLATLEETITKQIHPMGYKVIVVSKYAIPATVFDKADYFIYGKDSPSLMRDVIRFCEGEWDRIHFLGYDVEVDIKEFICKVAMSEKPICISSRCPELMSGSTIDLADLYEADQPNLKNFGHIISYMDIVADHRFRVGDPKTWPADTFDIHFVDGPYLKINGMSSRGYRTIFGTPDDPDEYELVQRPGMWSKPKKKYFRDWTIRAELNGKEVFRHHLDLKGKRVMINVGSKALGDTLAWIPYVLEFQKKHECHVICSCWWRDILDYPELEIVAPGTGLEQLYASYEIGCFDDNLDQNVDNWRVTPLQKVAADILGLEYVPLRARLKTFEGPRPAGPYVCLSEHSTMEAKFWNRPGGWQEIVDYCISLGYEVCSISKEPTTLKNVKKFNKRKIEDTCAVLAGASFYIGLGHGPSWLAWTLGVPVVLISGFSEPWEEFPTAGRVINPDVCHGCFNDPSVPFDRGWGWCDRKVWNGRPVNKFECTREITPDMVKAAINNLIPATKGAVEEVHDENQGNPEK